MSFDVDKLYSLLPAVYRIRDMGDKLDDSNTEDYGVLKALLKIISDQIAVLDENIDQLYDDQFIETCQEWVIPYIGDLVGTRGLVGFPGAPFSQRGQVAKTIAYRRRKGTAAVLEEIAYDVTGWRANVVEYFQLLATTVYMNHLRKGNLATTSLRKRDILEYVNTPFDKTAHTADVRRIEKRRGKYNIPNIGVFLWRIQSYELAQSPAYKVDDRRFKFDALGKDVQLYNFPITEEEITHLATPINIPMPIRRWILSRSLETYYGKNSPNDKKKDKSILLLKNGAEVLPVPGQKMSDLICICNLSDVPGGLPGVPDWSNMPEDKIAIDPQLGRIALPLPDLSSPGPFNLQVNYYYGFSADIGGGSYERNISTGIKKLVEVPGDATSIEDAVIMLKQMLHDSNESNGVIKIMNSDYHEFMAGTKTLKAEENQRIEIIADENCRPVLIINEEVNLVGHPGAEVSFNGLLFCGGCINVPYAMSEAGSVSELNMLNSLEFTHCTLVPGSTPFDTTSAATNPRLKVACFGTTININKCIVGGMRVTDNADVIIRDSILDAGGKNELAYADITDILFGSPLTIENSTVIGRVKTIIMQLASNTIFFAENFDEPPVMAERLQEGCVRYSYIPLGSRLPHPYHCQPAPGADTQRIKPSFTSLRYGDASYCQLNLQCAAEIRQGAENDMEMGVFYHLYQPLREYNLLTRLNEYLRFGLEAGIFYGS